MKECEVCQKPFTPQRMGQKVCGYRCAAKHVKKAKAEEKQETKRRKAALKTIPELIKEAQTAFNAYVRYRDREKPCICCGLPLDMEAPGIRGGTFDCGHFRSTGSASHLRFNQDNAHGQRKSCNRYGAGRAVDYRIGLIARIGLERVEALESNNQPHKWTRDELIDIKREYVEKLKQIKEKS